MDKIESVLSLVEHILGCDAEWGEDYPTQRYAIKLVWHARQMPSRNTYSIAVQAMEEEIRQFPEEVLVEGIVREVIRVIKGTVIPEQDKAIFDKIPGYSSDGWYDTDKARLDRIKRERVLMENVRKLAEEAAIESIKETLVKRSQPAPSPGHP